MSAMWGIASMKRALTIALEEAEIDERALARASRSKA